jgi:hypothetical protein
MLYGYYPQKKENAEIISEIMVSENQLTNTKPNNKTEI